MPTPFHIVVCGSIVPDPLQTLEPVTAAAGPALKNESLLPAVLDPWAGHALFEAANLARQMPGCKVWLVSLGPKGQAAAGNDDRGAESALRAGGAGRAGFRLHRFVRDRGRAGRGHRRRLPAWTAPGCCCSAAGNRPRAAPAPRCRWWASGWASREQFQGVDRITVREDGSFEMLERVEGGKHQVSVCAAPPGRAGLGDGQSARAAQQSAGGHGQHAHHHAGAAARQTGAAGGARACASRRSACPSSSAKRGL